MAGPQQFRPRAVGEPVLVVGFGITGQAVARHFGEAGREVRAIDDRPDEAARQAARTLDVSLFEAPSDSLLAALIGSSSLVVPSPGVPVSHPVYRLAAESDVPVRSEVELAWERLSSRVGVRPLLVAVTGTNGKTTVTTLVAAMLEASGIGAVAAGNIGLPLIDAVGLDTSVVVAEVSSFQLQYTEAFHPAVSCWLNLAEDHLDWHPSVDHYRAAKARVWANQGDGDTAVINLDDQSVMTTADDPALGVPAGVSRVTFSIETRAEFGIDHDHLTGPSGLDLVAVSNLRRSFPHDLANDLAAAATAIAARATVDGCRQVLVTFEGLPHRVQLVAESGGVGWYDDSKATTPASVLAAVEGFSSVVLIAGGRNKGLDLTVLKRTAPPVRSVVAIGEAGPEVEHAFAGVVPVTVAMSMEDAVTAAGRLARPGDVVLLSPGCASFDWYGSYHERGNDFAARVTDWLGQP